MRQLWRVFDQFCCFLFLERLAMYQQTDEKCLLFISFINLNCNLCNSWYHLFPINCKPNDKKVNRKKPSDLQIFKIWLPRKWSPSAKKIFHFINLPGIRFFCANVSRWISSDLSLHILASLTSTSVTRLGQISPFGLLFFPVWKN